MNKQYFQCLKGSLGVENICFRNYSKTTIITYKKKFVNTESNTSNCNFAGIWKLPNTLRLKQPLSTRFLVTSCLETLVYTALRLASSSFATCQ